MGFQDILKKSFMENYSVSDLTTTKICIALAVTALIGLYIFIIYRVVSRKGFYSKSFNVSLVSMAMITAAIILTIQSSVVISLGMVGALSIVRFRTAIKDPMDLVFLFWSISAGIICGACLFEVAIVSSILVTLVILVLEMVPTVKAPMLLVAHMEKAETENALEEAISKYTKIYKVKSRNFTQKGLDVIYELRTKSDKELFAEVSALQGVGTVSLLNHDGEVTY